uniref:Uncharacterized protein LOC102801709 n=1 Tax=Saccoglossus kowalevskii TaxID=10224 RepID=A0ABM0M5T3_SACKO
MQDGTFDIPITEPAINTTSTYAEWTAPDIGTYHCTVVAYNRALEPSNPVCSDGITIDTSPPTLSEIVIDDAIIKAGVIKDGDGNVWMVNTTRYRHQVVNVSDECRNVARLDSDIELLPLNPSEDITSTDTECIDAGPLSTVIYYNKENHFSLSWQGDDPESGIYDYEVGLSSTSSGLSPDILPFTSTNSHRNFLTYHPNLAEGLQFYVVLKSINRAELTQTKVIGPLFVEVTPPVFTGDIDVTLETYSDVGYLVARWNQDDFYDGEDAEPLIRFEYGVGTTTHDTNILDFTILDDHHDNDLCVSERPPSCVSISVDKLNWHLHGDHSYYVFIRVTNTAGLISIAKSAAYRHVVEPPSKGIVCDILPLSEYTELYGEPHDIDFQTSRTSLHIRWSGFSHPYLDVRYEAALGTTPGEEDVVGFKAADVGHTYLDFNGLNLENFKKYFATVRASNDVGSVTVSSDGVRILSDQDVLTSAKVYDGLGCTRAVSGLPTEHTNTGTFSHHSNDGRHVCQEDLEFQASMSSLTSYWNISGDISDYITDVHWGVQRLEHTNESDVWDFVKDFENLGMAYTAHTAMQLHPGDIYRSIVKFCHTVGCFQPVTSDGVTILPYPPSSEGISYVKYYNETDELEFSWRSFGHNLQMTGRDVIEYIDYYEWTITIKTNSRHGDALFVWQLLEDPVHVGDEMTYRASLDHSLQFTECLQIGLRGYTKAGLYTTVYKDIYDCDAYNPVLIVPNIVIDASGSWDEKSNDNGDIFLEINAHWNQPDAEYTRAIHKLAAVWPTLRYNQYDWKVISDDSVQRWAYLTSNDGHITYEEYDCSSPEVMACGSTNENFINIHDLPLVHGQRYYVCIYSNATKKVYEYVEVLLPEISVCSDGITVDQSPPLQGNVWIGWREQHFQSAVSELIVNWQSFVDVEEEGRTTHYSGIRKYEYAIGSSPDGVDVQDFIDVGITNRAVAHGLDLQDGYTYYATVKATDFVGLTTISVSPGVTIDTTPPQKTDVKINIGGSFHVSTSSVSASWRGLFVDLESGISIYEWAVGSLPGFADIMPFTVINSEEGTSDENIDLELIEGHAYYVSVKAYNGAGMSTMATSWATIVDASPPIAGYVYDGTVSADQIDLDVQTDLSSLTARWTGFSDPHTGIATYTWAIGTCKVCDDTRGEQYVGVVTEMTADNLNLKPGFTYYTTVIACNAAKLCTTVTSDGVLIDNSPPVRGAVHDGISGPDIAYQTSRSTMAAHWYGFHDPQSQISHYEWRAGTTVGGEEIVPPTTLHLTEKVFISQMSQDLPLNTMIYVTVIKSNTGEVLSKDIDIAQNFNDFFTDVGPALAAQINSPEHFTNYLSDNHYTASFFLRPVSQNDVINEIGRLDPSKAMGPDHIHPKTIIHAAQHIASPLAHIINLSITT